MVSKKYSLIVFLLCSCQFAFAQRVVYLTSGLLINGVNRYGREALYSDTLAYQLYNQALQQPAVGKKFATNSNGDSIIWKAVQADSTNVFKTRSFGGGGYLYFNYQSKKSEVVFLNIKGNSAVYVNGVLHAGDPY